MKPLSLTIVDGVLCVRSAIPDWTSPRWIGNVYATTARARDAMRYLDISEAQLLECELRETRPGEYYVTNHKECPRTAPTGVYVELTHGAKSIPIAIEIADYPAPKTRLKTRYEDGHWWKETKAKWVRL